jgi:hypothetical protein
LRASSFSKNKLPRSPHWTFHHAGANRTDTPRAAMTVIYMVEGIRLIEPQRKQHYADWEAFMPGVKPGDVVSSELNPLLN